MAEPCRCPGPNKECHRSGRPMVGRLWEACAGVNIDPRVSESLRRKWDSRKEPDRWGTCRWLADQMIDAKPYWNH